MTPRSNRAPTDGAMLDALRVAVRPSLVAACGRAVLTILVGVALVLSVWKGLPVTASVIAAGGLVSFGRRAETRP